MNSFGRIFRVTSFGESHGPALGGVVDGCPPGLELAEGDIQRDLDRRRPGQSKYTTQRNEADRISILSGVFEGKTTGAPIGLLIRNEDARPKDYDEIKNLFRPGHADLTYHQKYGIRDYRGGGRSSARETVIRVAAGAIARRFLQETYSVRVIAHLIQVGHLRADSFDRSLLKDNPFFCADAAMISELPRLLARLRKEGDSVGACIQVEADNVPCGWGAPVFDRLDADLAKAMMSINAAKGVEIGAGFSSASQKGSEHRDEMTTRGFLSNNAGGILGGISTGQRVLARVAFKPTSSILKPGRAITTDGEETQVVVKGRHDPCVAIRAVPIVEAMLALTLMDHGMLHLAQCGRVRSTPLFQ